ncbi:MAG: cupin domain-containing protein [Bryobacteraceae bacterium]
MKLRNLALAATVISLAWAQRPPRPPEDATWAPKAIKPTPYTPPHRPHTKLAEVKAKHKGQANWSQVVVDDAHMHGAYVLSQPGTKVTRQFHPDTRAWWVVIEGEIRFEIEGVEPFVATRGSMVQAPMQTLYSMQTVGDKPSLRWQVGIAHAKTLYPLDVEPPKLPGFEFVKVKLGRTPGKWEDGNKPHINLHELAKDPAYRGGRFVHDDRAVSNIIYGYNSKMPPLNEKDRGHYHPECAEFWLIMLGQIRYPIEHHGVVVAEEGDVVYVPPFTFHAPRFWGEGASCRLAMNGYTNISHLRDAEPH